MAAAPKPIRQPPLCPIRRALANADGGGLYIPFIIALVAVVAWTGVWITPTLRPRGRSRPAPSDCAPPGIRSRGPSDGSPGAAFRLNITDQSDYPRALGLGLAARAWRPRLAYLHGLDTWVIAAPVGLTFTRPRGGGGERHRRHRHASISEVNTALPNFSFEGTKLAFAPAAGANPFALTAADKVQMHLRRGPDDQAAVMLKVDNGKAQLSGLFARMAGGKPISIILDSTLSNISAMKGDSWPQMVRNWWRPADAASPRGRRHRGRRDDPDQTAASLASRATKR